MMQDLVWSFETAHFRVECLFSPDDDADLSFDDTGETRANVAAGLWQVFSTEVRVVHVMTGAVLGQDHLGGSIYENPRDFIREHLGHPGTYFADMVREAIREARKNYRELMVVRIREEA